MSPYWQQYLVMDPLLSGMFILKISHCESCHRERKMIQPIILSFEFFNTFLKIELANTVWRPAL